MLTIEDFQKKQLAQEDGKDSLDAVDSEYSVFLVPEPPVADLPELRVRIWPYSSADNDGLTWTWNWRAVHPGPEISSSDDGPEFRLGFVSGETEYDTSYGSIDEAAKTAIGSINDYLEKEMPAERRLQEQRALAEQERTDRIQEQINAFLAQ